MNIDPIKRQPPTSIEGVTRRGVSTQGKQGALSGDAAVLDNITQQKLLDQVRDLPEVRSDIVEIGRRLAQDPNYPPDEIIDKIANLLADVGPDWLDGMDVDVDVEGEQPDAGA